MDPFIRGHSPGDTAKLESGPFQASQVGRKLFSKSTLLTPNFPFAADGHRSGFSESLWGSGHSPDLDAEILPALTVYEDNFLLAIHNFQAIVYTHAVLRVLQSLAHGLTVLLAQASLKTSFFDSPSDSHGRHL